VSATAQGTKNGGTAQTQVSGTYTGKGSFTATAQTSDKDRSAQAQVDLDEKYFLIYLPFPKGIWWKRRSYVIISGFRWRCQFTSSNSC
jgi:hypothetical protein